VDSTFSAIFLAFSVHTPFPGMWKFLFNQQKFANVIDVPNLLALGQDDSSGRPALLTGAIKGTSFSLTGL
jgi:hypothetical protein